MVIYFKGVTMEGNSEKKFNTSNLEKGLQLVREGNLHQADMCFDAEMTQSNRPNSDVFIHHGHLLNRLGRYQEAIDKFDSFLNNHPNDVSYLKDHPKDVSCLFGKGISNMGLLKLDVALSLFKDVIHSSPSHADAYFYSAIIYYQNYNLNEAIEAYKMYQSKREDFFNNNPDYFYLLGDDLSYDKLKEYYDEMHNFYNLSDLFIFIDSLLERECADNSIESSYKQLRLLNDGEFKIVGYDGKLIKDLYSKFDGLTTENKRTLNKILYRSKDYDISFRDLHDLIRINVFDGNESIDSFYENLEKFINSRIDENNRELNRFKEKNKELEMEKQELKDDIESLADENWKLNNKNKKLKEKNSELYNQLYHISADKSDKESRDKNISIFGDDFKNANSLNRISGINNEDYEKDLAVLVSNEDIPKNERIDFKSAFEKYDEHNFSEAYEIFKKVSNNFKWPQLYMNFLKAISLSSDNKFEEAYVNFLFNYNQTKLGEKYNKDKYPILWFNFGNICFDYANSQSGTNASNALKLANFCYKNAKNIVSEKKSKSKSKSNYKFNFKDEKSKEDFENDVQMMSKRVDICKNLLEIEKLKK